MKPGPYFGNERNQCEGILELERPFGRLVPKHNHTEEAARPAAESSEHHEAKLGHPQAGTLRAPFVDSEHQKRHRGEGGEPNSCK